ncbi:MAG: DNA repair protein RecN, partial [Actinobacteria bacterium]|nr:DNA repair protein RecN [Actinomycetota bacterium]
IRVKELRKSLGDRDREIASLKATLNEFEKLKPRRDEFLELVALIERLESVEDLRVAATGALQALDDEQSGAMNSLHAVRRYLSTIKGKDAQLDEISERFGEAFYTLNDVNSDLARYLDGLSADPTALDNAQSRRAALISFAKKQGLSGDNDGINEALEIALNARARMRLKSASDFVN